MIRGPSSSTPTAMLPAVLVAVLPAVLVVAVLFAAVTAAPGLIWADDTERDYRTSAEAFHRLKSRAHATPRSWRALADGFMRIQQAHPKHKRSPDALFSAGLCLRRAFGRGGGREDLRRAVDLFHRLVHEYPRHPLADDALMRAGEIFYDSLGDAHVAYLEYRKVVALYPDGDQAPQAAKRARWLAPMLDPEAPTPAPLIRPAREPVAASKPAPNLPQPKAPTAKARAGSATMLKRVQYLSTPEWTRVILTLSGSVPYRQGELAATDEKPGRLYLDLPQVVVAATVPATFQVGDAALERIRVGRQGSGATRVVFDLNQAGSFTVKSFALPREYKLVIDFRTPATPALATPTPVIKSGGPSESRRQAGQGATSLNQVLGLKVKSIVIDPGHGGRDPGAVAGGLREKDVVLRIAFALRSVFRRARPDISVTLTREDDRFIPLSHRPKIAKARGADLFISIHVNASDVERLNGFETYFLNLTTDASAIEVAARENASTEKQVGDLNAILFDLLRDTNIIESSKLAKTLQATLIAHLRTDYRVRDLGVKQAPFMVLVGAEMPSVLVEAGFITNRAERRRMSDQRYLMRVAEGIYAGLEEYIDQKTVAGASGAHSPAAVAFNKTR